MPRGLAGGELRDMELCIFGGCGPALVLNVCGVGFGQSRICVCEVVAAFRGAAPRLILSARSGFGSSAKQSCVLVSVWSRKMSLRLCACVCLCRVVSALVVAPQQPAQPFSDAEQALARTCGGQCLAFLHANAALLGLDGASNASEHALLGSVAEEVGHTLKQATGLVAAEASNRRGAAAGVATTSSVACSTPASCAMKTMGANRCNYARLALQQTYNKLNVATHVLGVLVSSLCGCMHSGHVSSCAMRSVPPACTFPYTVYSKAFAGSAQVWEAVKASTQTCIIHGDASLLQ